MSITTFIIFLFCISLFVCAVGYDAAVYFFCTYVIPIFIVLFIMMKLVFSSSAQRDSCLDRQYEQAVEENTRQEESAASSNR